MDQEIKSVMPEGREPIGVRFYFSFLAALSIVFLTPEFAAAQSHRSRITPLSSSEAGSIDWGISKEKVKRIVMRAGVSLEESRYRLILKKGSMTQTFLFTAGDQLASVETEDDALSYSLAKKILTDLYGRPSSESDHLAKWSIGQECVHLESRSSGVYQRVFNVPLLVRYKMERTEEKTPGAVFTNREQPRENVKPTTLSDLIKPGSDGRYSSAGLKLLLTGKMDTQVLKLLGKPRSVTKMGTTDFWHYGSIAYDELTKRIFSSVQIVFENGVVRRLNFY